MKILFVLLVAAICNAAGDTPSLFVCVGTNVFFNWTVDVPPEGNILTAIWQFEPEQQENVTLAILINGQFYPQLTQFNVSYRPNAGIYLSNVTKENSGSYYVTVEQVSSNISDSVTSTEMWASLRLFDPTEKDTSFKVTVSYHVKRDTASGSWMTFLLCGPFSQIDQSSVNATWTTPSGNSVKSAYDNTTSSFLLPLASNVEADDSVSPHSPADQILQLRVCRTYVCRVDWLRNVTGCASNTSQHLSKEAQLHVDARDASLELLEAQQNYLSGMQDEARALLDSVSAEILALRHNHDAQLEKVLAKIKQQDVQLEQGVAKNEEQDKKLGQALSKNKEQDEHLGQAVAKNEEQDKQLEKAVARYEQHDRRLGEVAAKNEQQDVQLGEGVAKNVQQDKQLEEAVAKYEQFNISLERAGARNESQQQVLQLQHTSSKIQNESGQVAMLVQLVQKQDATIQTLNTTVHHLLKQFQQTNSSLMADRYNTNDIQASSQHGLASCVDWMAIDKRSGVRTIWVYNQNITVYCDQNTDPGGWLVIQRRVDGSVNFSRDWKDYEAGFGDLQGSFWLGLSHIYAITAFKHQKLRVDLRKWDRTSGYATYRDFYLDSPVQKYRLHYDKYIGGTAGDSLGFHKDQMFSTQDADNDSHFSTHCGKMMKSGWWYKNCHTANLNGIYKPSFRAPDQNGINWFQFGKSNYYSMQFAEMKIRPM